MALFGVANGDTSTRCTSSTGRNSFDCPDGRALTAVLGIVSKRLGSRYRSGRSPDSLKFKNPEAPAVKREAEEDWNG
jgi:hypothetical protein